MQGHPGQRLAHLRGSNGLMWPRPSSSVVPLADSR